MATQLAPARISDRAPASRPAAFPRGLLALLALAIAITSFISFETQQESLKLEAKHRLARIADVKAERFSGWLNEKRRDAQAVSVNRFFGASVERWLESGARADAAGGEIQRYLAELMAAHEYAGVVLFDRHSGPKLATGENATVLLQDRIRAEDAIRSGRISASDFETDESNHWLDFYVPLFAAEKEGAGPAALLMIRVSAPAFIYPLIEEWPVPSASAEALLVRREGEQVVYLTALRHERNAPLRFKLPLNQQDLPAALAVQGREGEVDGVDYRGGLVVAALRTIPDSPWHLVAKIDAAEAYAPVRTLVLTIAAMAALAFFGVGGAMLLWWRAQLARFGAREAQSESERLALVKHFDYLAKFANDIIALADERGDFVEVNDRAASESGYLREELLRMNVRDLWAAEQLTEFEPDAGGAALAGRVFEARSKRKDGSTYPVEVSARTIEVEGRRYNQYIVRDITERKRADEALRLREERFRTLVVATSQMVWTTDAAGQVTEDIPSWRAYTGQTYDEARGAGWGNALHPEDRQRTYDVWVQAVQRQSVYDTEYRVRRHDGEFRLFSVRGAPVFEAGGGIREWVGTCTDITEKKQAERALRKMNRALKALSGCNEALIHASDEMQLLNDICRIIVDTGGYRLAWVGYAEHDMQKTIRPMAHKGYEPGYMEHTNISWADDRLGRGPLGIAIRGGQVQVVQDVNTDARFEPWRENAARLGYGSVLVAPLLSGSAVIGALSIHAEGADAFDSEEIALLGELAADMAFGIVTLRTRSAHAHSAERLQRSMEATIQVIAGTVEMRDPYTAGHQLRVAELATAIAHKMGLREEQIHGIRLAGMIHDLGKVHIPAEILSRPSKLSSIEIELVKGHPQAGYDILKGVDFPWPIAQIVIQHHERQDGSGYPCGLKADEILLEARILAVADVVEAMASHRPYRPALGVEPALQEIAANAGKSYDADVARVCIALFREKAFAFKD